VREAQRHEPRVTPALTTTHGSSGAAASGCADPQLVIFGDLRGNLTAEAICPHTSIEGDGEVVNCAYRLHFAPGPTPPACAFWSLTMCKEHQFFGDNPFDRYAVGDREPLVINHERSARPLARARNARPGVRAELAPSATGSFNVVLRSYWPKQGALNNT
jgi:hypothetical protein